MEVTFAGIAGSASSLAAALPGGYLDGADDATTVPSAPTATTAVIAWSPWIGPVIAGTSSVPPGLIVAWPGRADAARVAEHGPGRHAVGIVLGELLAVAPREGVDLGLQLGAVHQR